MLSARSQVSVRPLYGVEEFRKSRSMAGGMTGGFVLLALAVCLMTPSVKLLTPPKAPSSVMLMRVIRPEPKPEVKPVQPAAMRKLLSPESEVTIPVPPPVVERPKPPQEAPKTVAPEPVKPKPVKKAPPVKKKRPVVQQPQKPVPPSAPVGKPVEAPPSATPGTGVASVTAVAPPTISADGKVSACSLGKGSGFGMLDAATERLGEKLIGLDVPSVRGGKGFQVLVPVRYSLKDA